MNEKTENSDEWTTTKDGFAQIEIDLPDDSEDLLVTGWCRDNLTSKAFQTFTSKRAEEFSNIRSSLVESVNVDMIERLIPDDVEKWTKLVLDPASVSQYNAVMKQTGAFEESIWGGVINDAILGAIKLGIESGDLIGPSDDEDDATEGTDEGQGC